MHFQIKLQENMSNPLKNQSRENLMEEYRIYLRSQRGLTERTIYTWCNFVDRFLDFRFGDSTDDLSKINVSIRPTPYCEWFPECLKLQDEKDKQRSVLFPVL